MAADRRIDAAGEIRLVFVQLRIERVAHAVQPLKFEAVIIVRELSDGRHRQRVVGGELREDTRAPGGAVFRRSRRCNSDPSSPCG